jgi:DNA-binding transcriptional LysR family regulator
MNNVKKLSSLLIFAEVANKQSFTLAAKKLAMSKSAVSQHIKRLELDTGQQLLSRHTRGMSLTAAGEKLLSRCELLRDQVEIAYDELTASKEMPSGVFALTIPHSFEKNVVIPALKQLCLEFPLLQIDLHVTDKLLDLIENNFDASIYGGELKDSNYRALPIGSANEIFCASPSYMQKHNKLTTIEDLNNHQVIATSWQKQSLDVFEHSSPSDKQSVQLNYFAQANSLPSVLEFVLQDMGIALLPEFVVQSFLAKGDLIRALTKYQGKQWPFYMVHRFHGEKPIHITRFYQLVKHYFSILNHM